VVSPEVALGSLVGVVLSSLDFVPPPPHPLAITTANSVALMYPSYWPFAR
jgi:hypothetical protein